MKRLLVVPAYGRDYKSGREARRAWRDGMDFMVPPGPGPYLSVRDAESLKREWGVHDVLIVYNRNRSAIIEEL